MPPSFKTLQMRIGLEARIDRQQLLKALKGSPWPPQAAAKPQFNHLDIVQFRDTQLGEESCEAPSRGRIARSELIRLLYTITLKSNENTTASGLGWCCSDSARSFSSHCSLLGSRPQYSTGVQPIITGSRRLGITATSSRIRPYPSP